MILSNLLGHGQIVSGKRGTTIASCARTEQTALHKSAKKNEGYSILTLENQVVSTGRKLFMELCLFQSKVRVYILAPIFTTILR